jgi:hypothetical protein
MEWYWDNGINFSEMGGRFEGITIAAAKCDADFLFAIVFQIVQQLLHPVAFGKEVKGSTTFDFHPAPKSIGKRVFLFQMEIGLRQGGTAWYTNVFSVRGCILTAGKAKVWVKEAQQVLERL